MVLQKRLDYGFNGYEVPPTPRAARSARRRRVFGRKVDDKQMCPFDLLATVAGKLLLDGENSRGSKDISSCKDQSLLVDDHVKKERLDEDGHLKEKPTGPEICVRGFFVSEIASQVPGLYDSMKEIPYSQKDTGSGPASVITTSDCSEKVGSAEQLANCENNAGIESLMRNMDVKSSGRRISAGCKFEGESKKSLEMELSNSAKVSLNNRADMCSSESPIVWDQRSSLLVSLDNNVKFPLFKDQVGCDSFPVDGDDVKLDNRDDDENSSWCTRPSVGNKVFRPSPRSGDRRIRKLLASKYWKLAPKSDDDRRSNTGIGIRHIHHSRKNNYKRQRSQRDFPFKKRKLYHYSSVSCSSEGVNGDGTCSSPRKEDNGDSCRSGLKLQGAIAATPLAGERAAFHSSDPHVKLKIKSFKVPELVIEIPETATVGYLKRTVMEAVTAILGGGLRVGVLFQGKKVRDDNKTLLQSGISHDNKQDSVGFSLEPNASQFPNVLCPEVSPLLLNCETSQQLTRYRIGSAVVHSTVQPLEVSDTLLDTPGTNFSNLIESDHDSAPSPPDISLDKSTSTSRALVPVPAMNVEALAVAPARKPKRSEASQRRIRRPFSVSEVEALVQAVEKLGTGRWRDVKLRAFDNAKHRTYVDLKDKWKTLVHTARISPQQRRGEPVPQELLDRVLTAHAYWSQQQAKQHLKQQSENCHLL